MPVRDEEILPAVVVEIEEADAESDVLPVHPKPCPDAGIGERFAGVPVQRRDLLAEVGSDDVEPAVGVEITDTNAHARQSCAILVEGAACRNPDLPESAVMIVAVQQTRGGV